MKQLASIAATVLAFSFLSCNSNGSTKTNLVAAESTSFNKVWARSFIDSVNSLFAKDVALGDSVALGSFYWPDAELILDNTDPIKGSDIVKAWGAATRMGLKEMSFTTTDITGDSEFLVETGIYVTKSSPTNITDKGNYVVVWQKRTGEWKLYRDIGSTSMPAPKQ
jgi:ketosteroid isomerase-like protein